MSQKDVFWMACDSTEQLRAEYGPFHTREEAETEARKLRFGFLLRYEHLLGPEEEIEEVRCIFIELPDQGLPHQDLLDQDLSDRELQDKEFLEKELQDKEFPLKELPHALLIPKSTITFHTRCASCGESASHDQSWQAEVWADIHEFEHTRHKIRLFERARGEALKEIADWRGRAA